MNPLSVFARMVRSDNVYPLPVVKACFFVRILYAWFQNRRLYNPCWLNYVPIHLSVKLLSAKKCARSVFRKNFVRHCFFQSNKFFLLRYSSCLKSGFASNCFYRKRNYNLRGNRKQQKKNQFCCRDFYVIHLCFLRFVF